MLKKFRKTESLLRNAEGRNS